MGLRENILAADDGKIKSLSVPEWGAEIHIRTWTGAERDRMEARYTGAKGGHPHGFKALVACLSICDEKGERVFKDSDEAELAKKSAAVLERILQASLDLNDFGEEAVEEQAKNS